MSVIGAVVYGCCESLLNLVVCVYRFGHRSEWNLTERFAFSSVQNTHYFENAGAFDRPRKL